MLFRSGSAGGQGAGGLQGQLFPTQAYLGEDARVQTIRNLNRVLADATVLHTHAKFAHWNVKGMEFVGLHELFDEIAETFEARTDEIGERITALGGQAMGTAGMAVSNCSIPRMPTGAITGREYVEILADRLAVHDANLYDAIKAAEGCGDADTADLLNEVSREVSQYLWFLEAHLQTGPVGTSQGGSESRAPGGSRGAGGTAQGGGAGGMATKGTGGGMATKGTGASHQSVTMPSQQPAAGQSTPSDGGTSESSPQGGPSPRRG